MSIRRYFCRPVKIAQKIFPGVLSIWLMMAGLAPVPVVAGMPEYIALKVNFEHPTPVNLKKYGVNGALLATPIGYGSEELVDIYKQIGIVFTRFPGGSIGNFYQWKKGQFSCNRPPDERSRARIAQMNRSMERTKTTYGVDKFFEFVKTTGGDFTYVLNTMCDSPENNADLLSYMKKSNIILKYIEMANETDSGSYAWAYADAKAYLDSAKENYLAIKRNYPEAKIGLGVSSISFSGKHNPGKNGAPSKSWPDRPQQFDVGSANASFADALIIHIYGEPYDHRFWSSDPKTNREFYAKSLEQFNGKFNISMEYLKALGKGKSIWITEWGVTAPGDKQQGIFSDYLKSSYQALYMASALVSITLEERVEMANFHNVSDLWQPGKPRAQITPVGNVLGLFIDAAKKTDTVYSVQAGKGGIQGNLAQENGIKSVLFTSSAGGDLFVINEQDKAYVINRLDAGNKKFNNYSFDTLYIENDVFKNLKGVQKNATDIGKAGIELKPFSISRIRMH